MEDESIGPGSEPDRLARLGLRGREVAVARGQARVDRPRKDLVGDVVGGHRGLADLGEVPRRVVASLGEQRLDEHERRRTEQRSVAALREDQERVAKLLLRCFG